MSYELLSNLIHAAYLTFDHNSVVIAYVAGFIICTFLSLWKPNRYTLLMLLGFLTLAVGFEYDKHLVGPLTRQTLDSVVRNGGYNTITKLINITLGEIIPIAFFILGWTSIFVSIVAGTRKHSNQKV